MPNLAALLFEADRAIEELVAGRWSPETVARLAAALHELDSIAACAEGAEPDGPFDAREIREQRRR